jgi:hypothetical protein
VGSIFKRLVLERLDRIEAQLARVLALEGKLVALVDDLKAGLAKLDAETTAVGQNIAALAARIKPQMTDAEIAEVKAGFATLDARLQSLAVDPTVPVPPAPPALTALRARHP